MLGNLWNNPFLHYPDGYRDDRAVDWIRVVFGLGYW